MTGLGRGPKLSFGIRPEFMDFSKNGGGVFGAKNDKSGIRRKIKINSVEIGPLLGTGEFFVSCRFHDIFTEKKHFFDDFFR